MTENNTQRHGESIIFYFLPSPHYFPHRKFCIPKGKKTTTNQNSIKIHLCWFVLQEESKGGVTDTHFLVIRLISRNHPHTHFVYTHEQPAGFTSWFYHWKASPRCTAIQISQFLNSSRHSTVLEQVSVGVRHLEELSGCTLITCTSAPAHFSGLLYKPWLKPQNTLLPCTVPTYELFPKLHRLEQPSRMNPSCLAWETPCAPLNLLLQRGENFVLLNSNAAAYATRQLLSTTHSLIVYLEAKLPIPWDALLVGIFPVNKHHTVDEDAQWKQHSKATPLLVQHTNTCWCSHLHPSLWRETPCMRASLTEPNKAFQRHKNPSLYFKNKTPQNACPHLISSSSCGVRLSQLNQASQHPALGRNIPNSKTEFQHWCKL